MNNRCINSKSSHEEAADTEAVPVSRYSLKYWVLLGMTCQPLPSIRPILDASFSSLAIIFLASLIRNLWRKGCSHFVEYPFNLIADFSAVTFMP